jgi:hypothetical protein
MIATVCRVNESARIAGYLAFEADVVFFKSSRP